jgi:hypothetical protein
MTGRQDVLFEFDPAWAFGFDPVHDETAPIHLDLTRLRRPPSGPLSLQICWYPERWTPGAPIYGTTVWSCVVSPLVNELVLAAYHFPALTTPTREGTIQAGIDIGSLPDGLEQLTLLLTRRASDPNDTLAGDAIVTRAVLTYARRRVRRRAA